MTDVPVERPASQRRPIVGIVAVLAAVTGAVAILLAVVLVVPNPPAAPTADDATRLQRLPDTRTRDAQMLSTYGWVDREQQIVRIPIDRAMALVAAEHSERVDDN